MFFLRLLSSQKTLSQRFSRSVFQSRSHIKEKPPVPSQILRLLLPSVVFSNLFSPVLAGTQFVTADPPLCCESRLHFSFSDDHIRSQAPLPTTERETMGFLLNPQ